MARSRSFNRFHRFTAKRKRRLLRSSVPNLKDESFVEFESTTTIRESRKKSDHKEFVEDFLSMSQENEGG